MDQSQETKLTLRASNTEHATGSKRGKTLRPPRMVTCMVSRAFHRLHVFSALVLKVLVQFGFLLMHACGYDHQTSLSGSCCTKRSKTGPQFLLANTKKAFLSLFSKAHREKAVIF